MIAKENYLLKILEGNDKEFYIPVYQREYSWTTDNCKQLISDINYIINDNLKTHFFGSIVYTSEDLAGTFSYCIIDGQQRITTISLFLLAIFNCVKSQEKDNYDKDGNEIVPITKIKNSYFYIDSYKKNPELKLKLTDEDEILFKNLFKNNMVNESTPIGKNYMIFIRELSGKSISEISKIYDAIKRLSIVNIKLDDQDDPQLIFESLNSTGLPLLESDKIRNYIFMNFKYEDQKTLFEDYWRKIDKNVNDISKLIRFYLAIKTNRFISEKKLYYEFKDFSNNNSQLPTNEFFKKLLEELLTYSSYMKEISNYSKDSKYSYQKSLYRLNKLDMTTIYPLIFVCFDYRESNDISTDDLDQIMDYIESYIIRRFFLKLSTSPLNKIFAFLPADIKKHVQQGQSFKDSIISCLCEKNSNSRFPRNNEFKEAFISFELYNAKSDFKKYVLERLENFNHKEIVDVDNLVDKGKLTIEHVMPQVLSNEWRDYLGPNYETIHEKYLNTIGNLTLTGYNSEYSNLLFDEKKKMKEKGFLYSKLTLNEYIRQQSEWKEEQILNRANNLAKKALQIWIYPSTIETGKKTDEEFDIHNPNSWSSIQITQFGRIAFMYLFDNHLLTDKDIDQLKDKDYSKLMFKASYPIISDSRDKYSNGKIHYRKEKILYNNQELFLTFEWFSTQFEKLSDYIKTKMNI